MNKIINEDSWNLLIIEDEKRLSGESINKILNLTLRFFNVKFFALKNLEGAGKEGLIRQEKISYKNSKEVLTFVRSIIQLDFGDFFLLEKEFRDFNSSYPELIEQSLATIRCIDDSYFYIYSKSKNLIDALKQSYSNFNVEEKVGPLAKLDEPF